MQRPPCLAIVWQIAHGSRSWPGRYIDLGRDRLEERWNHILRAREHVGLGDCPHGRLLPTAQLINAGDNRLEVLGELLEHRRIAGLGTAGTGLEMVVSLVQVRATDPQQDNLGFLDRRAGRLGLQAGQQLLAGEAVLGKVLDLQFVPKLPSAAGSLVVDGEGAPADGLEEPPSPHDATTGQSPAGTHPSLRRSDARAPPRVPLAAILTTTPPPTGTVPFRAVDSGIRQRLRIAAGPRM